MAALVLPRDLIPCLHIVRRRPGALALEDSRRNRLRIRIQFHIHSLGRFAIDNLIRL